MPITTFIECARVEIAGQTTNGYRIKVHWFEASSNGKAPTLRPLRLLEDITVTGFSKHADKSGAQAPSAGAVELKGKGCALQCKYGELSMPGSRSPPTKADLTADAILFFWSRVLRLVVQSCVSFNPAFTEFKIPFGEEGSFVFKPTLPYTPSFVSVINHPSSIDQYKAFMPNLVPWSVPVNGATLQGATTKLLGKYDPSCIMEAYMAKPKKVAGKKIEKPYLTIYEPFLDYRTPQAPENSTGAIYVRAQDVETVMALSTSPDKPTKVVYGKNGAAAFKMWELLGVATEAQRHPAFTGTGYFLPEVWIGQSPAIRQVCKYFKVESVTAALGRGTDSDAPDFDPEQPSNGDDIPIMGTN